MSWASRFRRRRASVAAEALGLRGWAWELLCGASPGSPPRATAEAWSLFLTTERCALPLTRRLSAEEGPGLPAHVAEVLRAGREAELRRILSARSQLALIDRVAGRHGLLPVVLKGGAVAARPQALDVADLDILLPRQEAIALASALEEHGYRASARDVLDQPGVWHHLAQRRIPGAIPLEIHFDLHEFEAELVRAGSVPLQPGSALHQPLPERQLWHLLVHAAITHPSRRGNLRDLVLMATALSECGAAGLDEVQERIARTPQHRQLAMVCQMAASLHRQRPGPDHFRPGAAANYILRQSALARLAPPALRSGMVEATFLMLGDGADRQVFRAERREFRSPSSLPMVAWGESRLGSLGHALRRSSRALRFLVCAALAWPYARWARSAGGPGVRPPGDRTAAPV